MLRGLSIVADEQAEGAMSPLAKAAAGLTLQREQEKEAAAKVCPSALLLLLSVWCTFLVALSVGLPAGSDAMMRGGC